MKPFCALALLLACGIAAAHSGGTDAQGCHTNRKTGDYHCHGGKKTAGAAPATPTGPAAPAAAPVTPAKGGGPTCYVGPRGGTYTITKSGRKNYAGC
ncbi:YHYH domain-containing protein [Polaromonas sp. JS666]|uniref:YHYH domain-containing protein n=1 Tax=Polaromonas sp. (strain JS666 / ATCC BAA-500) TaxID=296591 RepID=UPI0009420429|nr:YHYH domain-containing protein [Polaromonas sp. JS666]